MENRLTRAMTEEENRDIDQDLNQCETTLRQVGKVLSEEERRKLHRPRKGSEQFIQLILTAAKEMNLDLPAHPMADVESDLRLQFQMTQLVHRISSLNTLATDSYNIARSEVWGAFLDYYNVLSAMADRNPALADRIRPVTEFMSVRKARAAAAQKDEEP